MVDLTRRSFLAATVSAAFSNLAAKQSIDRSRVSAISDEIARSPAEAIDFAHQYGLQWLSLRDLPAPRGTKKTAYHSLDEASLRQQLYRI